MFRFVGAGRMNTLPANIDHGEIVDQDAIEIGELYGRAGSSLVASVHYQIECGQRLAQKKSEMAHGEWLPWLDKNAGVLGFNTRRTAARLIKLAETNGTLANHFDEAEAVQISRQIWGNKVAHVSHNSGNNEWYTPAHIIEAARRVMGRNETHPRHWDQGRAIRYRNVFDN